VCYVVDIDTIRFDFDFDFDSFLDSLQKDYRLCCVDICSRYRSVQVRYNFERTKKAA